MLFFHCKKGAFAGQLPLNGISLAILTIQSKLFAKMAKTQKKKLTIRIPQTAFEFLEKMAKTQGCKVSRLGQTIFERGFYEARASLSSGTLERDQEEARNKAETAEREARKAESLTPEGRVATWEKLTGIELLGARSKESILAGKTFAEMTPEEQKAEAERSFKNWEKANPEMALLKQKMHALWDAGKKEEAFKISAELKAGFSKQIAERQRRDFLRSTARIY